MRWRSPTKGTSPRTRPSHQFWDGSITQICWWWFFPSGKPTMTGEAKKGICFVLGDHPKQIWGKDVTCKLRVHFILTPTTWATSYFCFSGSTARCQDQTQLAWIRSFSWWMHPLFPALIGWIIVNPAFALLIHYPFFYCLNPCSFWLYPIFWPVFYPWILFPTMFFWEEFGSSESRLDSVAGKEWPRGPEKKWLENGWWMGFEMGFNQQKRWYNEDIIGISGINGILNGI